MDDDKFKITTLFGELFENASIPGVRAFKSLNNFLKLGYYSTQRISYFRIKESGVEFLKEWKIISSDSYLLSIMDMVFDSIRR
jgi:hypothetical protein